MEIGDKQGLRSAARRPRVSGRSFKVTGANGLKRIQASAAFSSCATIRSMRADKVSFDSLSRRRSTINGKRKRRRALERSHFELERRHLLQRRLHASHVQFILEHFALGLFEKPIGGVVFAKHVVKESRRGLHHARLAPRAWKSARNEAGNMGDVAKAPARQFARVEARNDLFRQRVDGFGRRDAGTGSIAAQSRALALKISKP